MQITKSILNLKLIFIAISHNSLILFEQKLVEILETAAEKGLISKAAIDVLRTHNTLLTKRWSH